MYKKGGQDHKINPIYSPLKHTTLWTRHGKQFFRLSGTSLPPSLALPVRPWWC